MSLFRGNQSTPPPSGNYARVPDSGYNNSLPRGAGRPVPPTYNDPSAVLFDRRPTDRKPPPPRYGGRYVPISSAMSNYPTDVVLIHSFGVVSSPSDALALSNCLIVHPSDFQQGQHVLVKGNFPCTTRSVFTYTGHIQHSDDTTVTIIQINFIQVRSARPRCSANGLACPR
jgi:vesicle-fusing ATPase